MASDPQELKTDTKRPEALPLERVETISKDITVEVMGAAGNIEQEVKASVVVQRIETIGQDVQALQSVQIVEKDIKPFAEFLLKLGNDWSLTLAASLAYHLLVAMFPIAIVLLSIFGLFPGTRQFFIQQIKKVFPEPLSSTDVVSTILHKLPTTSGIIWLIAILIAVFTGSRLFALIEGCFNIIYQVHARPFLRQNLMAIAMLLLFIVCIPLMIFMSSAPAFVLSLLQNTSFGKLPDDSIAFSIAGIIGSLAASTILFGAIYVVVPNQHISIRNTWRGTVVAAITLQIYLILFPIYVANFLRGYDGQVGFAIVLLAFFYYFAVILLLGAEVNAFFAEGKHATSADLATLVHASTSPERKAALPGQQLK
jgi:membrane protein